MLISINCILDYYGGQDKHSILHILQNSNNENFQEEVIIFENTKYIDNETLVDILKEKHLVFKVLSLNCQSLHAKIDRLKILLNDLQEQGCFFDAICLQETWINEINDMSIFHIDGYEFISKSIKFISIYIKIYQNILKYMKIY